MLPFGLEPSIDTHFTVRQLISSFNLGAKMDWGMSINGALQRADYEVAVLRGSGMEYVDKGDNYSISGRIGTPYDQNLVLGLSGFIGEVIDPGKLVRYRIGGGKRASQVGGAGAAGPM